MCGYTLYNINLFAKFTQFRAFVKTLFKTEIMSFQCDHSDDFDNHMFHHLIEKNGNICISLAPAFHNKMENPQGCYCTNGSMPWIYFITRQKYL